MTSLPRPVSKHHVPKTSPKSVGGSYVQLRADKCSCTGLFNLKKAPFWLSLVELLVNLTFLLSVWAPKSQNVNIQDIQASQTNRWSRGGHIHLFYTVYGQYSMFLWRWLYFCHYKSHFGGYLIALWLKCNLRIWTCVPYALGALQGGVTFGRNQGAFCFRQISEFHNHGVTEKSCLTCQYLMNAATCRNSVFLSLHAWSKCSFLHTLNIYVLIWAIFL